MYTMLTAVADRGHRVWKGQGRAGREPNTCAENTLKDADRRGLPSQAEGPEKFKGYRVGALFEAGATVMPRGSSPKVILNRSVKRAKHRAGRNVCRKQKGNTPRRDPSLSLEGIEP